MVARYGLLDGLKCTVSDAFWIYAGCDDAKVCDLAAKIPHVAYEIAEDVESSRSGFYRVRSDICRRA
ncbi:hypothetical protein NOGI109294_03445 [Nocardiopsis gilva]|uniref:hypothetical protein n=1 Tax=Nocardiopsis gilva TaxID=280236 RepID=UPI001E40B25A|nr:hypothetical protein [Nocardiopsis gilva]